MSPGDVRVFGLVAGTYVIEDIQMAVGHGREVVIPAEKAAKSRDLWRAISQKSVFRLPDAQPPVYAAPVTFLRDDVLQERNGHLEARNKLLEEENARLRAALATAMEQREGLDSILQAIRNLPTTVVQVAGSASATVRADVADGTAPQFIPEEIAPKDAEVRIDRVAKEADSTQVSDAAARLRQMRKGGGG